MNPEAPSSDSTRRGGRPMPAHASGVVSPSERPVAPVLVVEDNTDVRNAWVSLLASRGYRVAEAEDGVQALKLLRNQELPPCLIVLDMMMPRMSGWDFCAVRSRDERLRSIPLVVVSAHPLAQQATRVGAAAVLPKPADPAQLLALVEQHHAR
jgi:CheY-like chemotaxis protein